MSSNLTQGLGSICIVGGGTMGQAICAGLLSIDDMQPSSVSVVNPGEQKRAHIEATFKVATFAQVTKALPADTIILAVKPVLIGQVTGDIAACSHGAKRIISVAAGVATSKIASVLGNELPIIRVMPNTPLVCGKGMSVISGSEATPLEECELVRDLFANMGHALIVPESMQDAVTAISGSGPAYFELFVETIARSGEQLGLDYETALELALQTMYGTAALIDETHQSLPEAIAAVSSPGGTTVAALDAMRGNGLESAIDAGVKAAAARSMELGE